MAKRKLSEKDRNGVRRIIKRGLAAKKETSVILKEAAKKYGFSTETARWYLKSMSNGNGSRRKSTKAAGSRSARANGTRPGGTRPNGTRRRGPGRPKGSKNKMNRRRKAMASTSTPVVLRNAGTPALFKKAQAAARDRALEVATLKKLLPEYSRVSSSQAKLRSRLKEVRQLERAVSGSLRQANKRAKKLETQLKGLI